jgi:tape measure domain-containing protein
MATEVATLLFEADTRPLRSANDELAKTERAGVKAENAARKMGTELKKAANDSINPIQNVTKGISSLQTALIAIASSVIVGSLVNIANQFTDLNSRLINATGSAEAADQAFKAISETARTTYSSLQQTAQGFLQNNLVLTELGYTTKEQLDLMASLNNSLVISGAKGEQAAMIMGAFGRAMAEGKLKGQELNLMMTYSARTVQALADGLGVTTIELRRMVQAGEVDAQAMFTGLTSQLGLLTQEAEKMPATIADGLTLFKNSVFGMVGTLNEISGASLSAAGLIVGIADSVQGFTERIITAKERQEEFNVVFKELEEIVSTGYVPALDLAMKRVHQLIGLKINLLDVQFLENQSFTQNQEVIERLNQLYGEASRLRQRNNQLLGNQNSLSEILNGHLEKQKEITAKVTENIIASNAATEASMSLTSQTMAAISNEIYMLSLNSRERALRINILAAGNNASKEEVAAIIAVTNALHDEKDALIASQAQRDSNVKAQGIAEGLMSQEEQIRNSYDRQRKIILDSTEFTSQRKDEIKKQLDQKEIDDLNAFNNKKIEIEKRAALDRFSEIVRIKRMESAQKNRIDQEQLEESRQQNTQLLAFEDVLLEGKSDSTKEAYRIAVNFADKEKRLAAEKIIVKSYEAAMNAYASLSAIPFVGPALGAAAAAVILAAGVSYSAKSLSGRALGGQVRSGESYVVGERGPEILTMGGSSGKVIPNSAITSGSMTGTVNNTANVTFSIVANDTRGFDELLLKRRGMIASLVQSSLNNLGRSI